MRRILLKRVRLQQATEAGDAEFWITQIVARCVRWSDTKYEIQLIIDLLIN